MEGSVAAASAEGVGLGVSLTVAKLLQETGLQSKDR